jgi:hypothetical protein
MPVGGLPLLPVQFPPVFQSPELPPVQVTVVAIETPFLLDLVGTERDGLRAHKHTQLPATPAAKEFPLF